MCIKVAGGYIPLEDFVNSQSISIIEKAYKKSMRPMIKEINERRILNKPMFMDDDLQNWNQVNRIVINEFKFRFSFYLKYIYNIIL